MSLLLHVRNDEKTALLDKERLEESGYTVTIKQSMQPKFGLNKKKVYGVYATRKEPDILGISTVMKSLPEAYRSDRQKMAQMCYKKGG